eukprot:4284441-Alexandrium_andersonii.AAC.1
MGSASVDGSLLEGRSDCANASRHGANEPPQSLPHSSDSRVKKTPRPQALDPRHRLLRVPNRASGP